MRPGQGGKGRVGGKMAGLGLVVVALAGLAGVAGCASEPKEPPPRSVNEIRGDSDRLFDRVKQEERERSSGPASGANP